MTRGQVQVRFHTFKLQEAKIRKPAIELGRRSMRFPGFLAPGVSKNCVLLSDPAAIRSAT